ncbi:MAG: RES family NAD+ phosphorylase [Ahrensia sp.]|nr:RES family NAD+ phosphorylase [Ahrensia sp.]
MKVWRISNHADLSGTGGKFTAGRWNHLGRSIVYCADHPALALLELLVHVDLQDLPTSYQLLEINLPDGYEPFSPSLPDNWRDDEIGCRHIWEQFCRDGTGMAMRVPSVIMPYSYNILLNSEHPAILECSIASITKTPFDQRLIR